MGVFSVVVAAAVAVASGGGKLQDNCIHSCLSVQIYIYFRYMLYILLLLIRVISWTLQRRLKDPRI